MRYLVFWCDIILHSRPQTALRDVTAAETLQANLRGGLPVSTLTCHPSAHKTNNRRRDSKRPVKPAPLE